MFFLPRRERFRSRETKHVFVSFFEGWGCLDVSGLEEPRLTDGSDLSPALLLFQLWDMSDLLWSWLSQIQPEPIIHVRGAEEIVRLVDCMAGKRRGRQAHQQQPGTEAGEIQKRLGGSFVDTAGAVFRASIG